ncbi:LLM class flavin-dependent oxidoreductase [Nocardioides sp. L-11A]|uniref:LLM class flavin-dependent oxidoreductase n=1 Tax=Nocardioides sp. L-11A TaxID=3043848 RepID=UPI002499B0FF|nr:LLM class flavin-dependent oxidoreductase [Nocardioides sp. L-11A]
MTYDDPAVPHLDAQQRVLLALPLNAPFGQGPAAETLARAAEQAGFDLFSLTDHPYGARSFEAYGLVGYLLGRTSRIGGYVGVSNLPLRPAPMLARTVATLSSVSGGRLVLALGAGGFWEHIARMGVDPLTPGEAVAALAEGIEVIRGLTGSRGGAFDFAGEHYRVDHLAPSAVPTPPIWTGAGGPKSLALTGRRADGWIPQSGADWLSTTYREGRPRIDDAARSVGRSPDEIRTVFNIGGVLARQDLPATRGDDGRLVGGSARQWVDELAVAVLDHGAGGFNVGIADESGARTAEVVRRFGDEVVAPLRERLG